MNSLNTLSRYQCELTFTRVIIERGHRGREAVPQNARWGNRIEQVDVTGVGQKQNGEAKNQPPNYRGPAEKPLHFLLCLFLKSVPGS